MLKFQKKALLAAMTLCVAPMSAATAATVPAAMSAPQEREAAAMQEWLARTAAWTRGYSELTTRRVDTILWLTDAPNTLVTKLNDPSKARAREWVTTWAAEARARLASEMDFYRSLPTEIPRPAAIVPLSVQNEMRLTSMGRLADRTGTLMISTGQACEEYIQLMEAAASGRQEDLVRLDAGFYKLTLAHLQAEVVMMEGFAEGSTGPAREFAMTQVESNRAIIVWTQHLHDQYFGNADGAATAVRLRGHATTMREIVARLRVQLRGVERDLRSNPEMGATPFGQTMARVLASMHETAAVEEQIADAIDALADAAARNDEAAGTAAGERISALVTERIRLDAVRREMLAGAQS